MHHDFHWLLIATKLLTAEFYSLYIKESESKILERSESGSEIWKGREIFETKRWIFYLRLRNPVYISVFLHQKCVKLSNAIRETVKTSMKVFESGGRYFQNDFLDVFDVYNQLLDHVPPDVLSTAEEIVKFILSSCALLSAFSCVIVTTADENNCAYHNSFYLMFS